MLKLCLTEKATRFRSQYMDGSNLGRLISWGTLNNTLPKPCNALLLRSDILWKQVATLTKNVIENILAAID